MTNNKRFVDNGCESVEDSGFEDTLTGKNYYVDYFDEIVNLVNELSEENERLKAKASSWKITCSQESNEKNVLFMKNRQLQEENEQLRQVIKENVFRKYAEGSLADLEFKTIAYDDIVRVEMSNELEPKVIVYCKQGKKENIISYCQMVIPFGVPYKIEEVIDDEW